MPVLDPDTDARFIHHMYKVRFASTSLPNQISGLGIPLFFFSCPLQNLQKVSGSTLQYLSVVRWITEVGLRWQDSVTQARSNAIVVTNCMFHVHIL